MLSNEVKTRIHRVLTSMLRIHNNVSAIVSQNNPKFVGDMISAKICQKIIILSAIWFRRKSEEGSDACNTDCGNRVDSKQRSVTAWSTVETKFCRYTELIRLCFQHKWIASLGAVSTVLCTPLQTSENQSEVLHLFRWYTHTLTSGHLGRAGADILIHVAHVTHHAVANGFVCSVTFGLGISSCVCSRRKAQQNKC